MASYLFGVRVPGEDKMLKGGGWHATFFGVDILFLFQPPLCIFQSETAEH